MKKTVFCGALLAVLCIEAQADSESQPAAVTSETTATTASAPQQAAAAPIQSSTQPSPTNATQVSTTTTSPALPTPTPSSTTTVNCDYKIAPNTKTIDPALIISWSQNATKQSFDFNPKSIDDQLKNLQNCFTEQGWVGFNTALQKSGNVQAIKTQNLTVSSQVDGDAQITDNKDSQWKVNMPLQVVYQNDKEKVTQLLTVQLTVGRKINGDLGIAQLLATPRPATPAQPTETKPSSSAAAETPATGAETSAGPAATDATQKDPSTTETKPEEQPQTTTPATSAPTH